MAGKSDSQLNEIYKQQYLKSIGKDDVSKRRKREEALKYIDEWIEETYQTRDAEQMFRRGEQQWEQRLQEEERTQGRSCTDLMKSEEIRQAAKRQFIEEVGTKEEYANEYVENELAPRGLLGLIVSIRELLEICVDTDE
jgi:hypothetical protein